VCAEEGESTRGRGGRPKKYYRLAPPALEVLRASADSYARLAGLIGDALPRLQGER
jgi:hypothetical protein